MRGLTHGRKRLSRTAVCALLCVGMLVLTTPTAAAHEEEEERALFADMDLGELLEQQIDPIVTTGSKRRQRLSESLSTMSVITREDIEATPHLYLGDLLRYLPGLDVRWGRMQRMHVNARGLGGTGLNSRMLLLRDGQVMNDPLTGELHAGHFVPLADVERVEVVRGPGSSLYGANAFSGVINLITRNRSENDPSKGIWSSLLLGSFETFVGSVTGTHSIGPVKVRGSVEGFKSEGPFPTVELLGEEIKNDDVYHVAASLGATYGGFAIDGRYVEGERGRPGQFPTHGSGHIADCASCHTRESPKGSGEKFTATPTSCGNCHVQPRDREHSRMGSVYATYNRELGAGFALSASAYHNEWRDENDTCPTKPFLKHPTIVRHETKQRASGGDAHVEYDFRNLNSLVFGVDGRRAEAASDMLLLPDGSNRADQSTVAVFLEDEVRPFDFLSITAGGRVDFDDLMGTAFSGRAGLLCKPIENGNIHAVVGHAFRNPSFSELYVQEQRGKYLIVGNPDLQREEITTYEVGLSYSVGSEIRGRLGGSFFYSEVDNLIGFTAVGLSEATFVNLVDSTVLGAELEGEIRIRDWGELFANYSYQDAEDGAGDRLPYAPENKVSFGLRARRDPFNFTVVSNYVSSRKDNMEIDLPGYLTADAGIEADIGYGLGLSLWIRNFTDEAYQESLGIPAAERSFYISLTHHYP